MYGYKSMTYTAVLNELVNLLRNANVNGIVRITMVIPPK